jgi:hypothetical protein
MNIEPFFASFSSRRISAQELMAALFLCCVVLVSPASVFGTTYTYTGNFLGPDPPYAFYPPYTTSDFVTGYFSLNTPLADNLPNMTDITSLVTDFSFTDGVQTFNQSDSLMFEEFEVATNNQGAIDAWAIELGSGYQNVFISCDGDLSGTDACSPGNGWGIGGAADEAFDSGSVALREAAPGRWSATPEPSALMLFGSGILGVAGAVRRRLRR